MNYSAKSIEQIICGVQNYPWGCTSNKEDCLVYKYARQSHAQHPLNNMDQSLPYAELWMGSHPSLSSCYKNGVFLSNDPTVQVPFLFKVLSVSRALSIQAHPNKQQAQLLHFSDPKNYPDANHKPEMAISLGVFEALSGLAPHHTIIKNIEMNPCLIEKLGEGVWQNFLINADIGPLVESVLALCGDDLMYVTSRLVFPATPCESIKDIALQYPNDVGLIFVLLLNHVRLEQGEALFMEAGSLHAYLRGNCLECMANSDNVVRAGFTDKFKDTGTLRRIMISTMGQAGRVVPIIEKNEFYSIKRYVSQFVEFDCIEVSIFNFNRVDQLFLQNQSIMIITVGKALIKCEDMVHEISSGDTLLIRQNTNLQMDSIEPCTIYICTSQ